jgi:hypothetical protein
VVLFCCALVDALLDGIEGCREVTDLLTDYVDGSCKLLFESDELGIDDFVYLVEESR